MKNALLAPTAILLSCLTIQATDFYVARDGKDTQPGTADQPFATLTRARDAIRQLKQAGPLPQPVTVHVRGGTYYLAQPVTFTREDSGTAKAPIAYAAERGSSVRLTGGREITGWRPVTDPVVRQRLPAEARDHVRVADLRAQGITDFGKLSVRGFGAGSPPAEAELFYDDDPMTLARWPNEGFRGAKSKESDRTDCRGYGSRGPLDGGNRAVGVCLLAP